MKKLNVIGTIFSAYRFVFGNPISLLKVAAVPLLIYFLFIPSMYFLMKALGPTWLSDSDINSLMSVVIQIALLVAVIPFIVRWHRVTLATERPRFGLAIGRRNLKFVIYIVILTAAGSYPIEILVSLVPEQGEILDLAIAISIGAPIYYLWARLSFVLPAAAIGEATSLTMSWRQTSGNGIRLIVVPYLAYLPWYYVVWLVEWLFAETAVPFMSSPIELVLLFPSTAILTSCLCLAYNRLTGIPSGGSASPAASTA